MNHCGQSPCVSYCCAKTMRRISFDRLVVLQREKELHRTLADVARSPGRAGILLESVRHGQMDHRIVREPREQRVEGGTLVAAAPDAEMARDAPQSVAAGARRSLSSTPC